MEAKRKRLRTAESWSDMHWHGAEEEEQEGTSRRRGERGERGYETATKGGARSSRSPNGQKRRAVAADLFDDEYDDERERDAEHRRSRYHSSTRRSQSPQDSPSEHKRRKYHDRRNRDHHDTGQHHERRRHHHSRRHDKPTSTAPYPAELPFQARQLSYKHDFDTFTALFAYYLDIQKGIDFYALDSHEARGRWKSFVHKWNRGELAEGWYEPEMYERITRENPALLGPSRGHPTGDEGEDGSGEPERAQNQETATLLGKREDDAGDQQEADDVDDYGPTPPPGQVTSVLSSSGGPRRGPGIPTLSDLALQREAAADATQSELAGLRLSRKADRAQQKERLDELVPRAEPGTRERQLEKKALVNEKMRSFREGGDAMEEVGEKDLMGGGDDLVEYKRMIAAQQRKKTERELRREAEARARAAEREERLREWKEREEEKLKGLKELAKARFG